MDRIRKALDLARRERGRSFAVSDEGVRPFAAAEEAVRPSTVSDEGVRPFAAAEEAVRPFAAAEESVHSVERKADAQLPTPIRYTKTKTFTPSPDLLESNRIINATGADGAAGAFRMLRTQVLQRMEENNWRSLAIFSPGCNDGKTTTSINLAISLANDHRHTVLLVDFDLKRPTLAARLGINPEKGADDLLRGEARVEDCLYHPEGFDRLVLLPAREPMENSSEALAGPRGRELLMELRLRYADRIVLFDLPPILSADDALAFAPQVECGLLVIAEGSTRREDVLRCMELLRKTNLVGTVLNRATDATSAYG